MLSGDWRAPRRGRSAPIPAGAGPRRRGGRDGLGRRRRARREGGRHARRAPRGPSRTHQGVPARARASSSTGRPVTLTPPQAAAATALADARRAAVAHRERLRRGRRARAPGSRAARASTSRAATTPSSSRRCGATTCASRASSSSSWTASTTSPASSPSSSPGPGRRLGVLVDHLVPGTKEARIVEQARALPGLARHVKILGHPYVDVWQSVRPERLGWQQWPVIPRGTSWKHGICAELGWPHDEPGRHRPRVEAHPRHGAHLRRPRADPPRERRGAHRLRHRAGRLSIAATQPRLAYSRQVALHVDHERRSCSRL